MCGPVMPWDWFIMDLSYVLVLIGGGMVFRARNASVPTWMLFAAISTFVGVILFTFTFQANAAYAASATGDVVGMMASTC